MANASRLSNSCGQRVVAAGCASRQVWPPTIDGKLDHKLLKSLDLDQLWAEAWHRYLNGEQWWPTENEAKHQLSHIKEHEIQSPVEELLHSMWDFKLLSDPKIKTQRLSATEINELIFADTAVTAGVRQVGNLMPKVYPACVARAEMYKTHNNVKKWLVPMNTRT